jgi:hypothetical protein
VVLNVLVFIDTEFDNFTNMELISIGLISADKTKSFYMENADFRQYTCSPFVKAVVIPLLSLNLEVTRPKLKIEEMIREWCATFDDQIEIVIDYYGDWEILIELFNYDIPLNMADRPIHISQLIEITEDNINDDNTAAFFDLYKDEHRHHALSDAKANLWEYHKSLKRFY